MPFCGPGAARLMGSIGVVRGDGVAGGIGAGGRPGACIVENDMNNEGQRCGNSRARSESARIDEIGGISSNPAVGDPAMGEGAEMVGEVRDAWETEVGGHCSDRRV